jgi:hypothetical protein
LRFGPTSAPTGGIQKNSDCIVSARTPMEQLVLFYINFLY